MQERFEDLVNRIQTNKYAADAALIGLRVMVLAMLVFSATAKPTTVGGSATALFLAYSAFCIAALVVRARFYRDPRFDLYILTAEGLLTVAIFSVIAPVEGHLDYAYVLLIGSVALQLGMKGGALMAFIITIFDYDVLSRMNASPAYGVIALRHTLSWISVVAFGLTHHSILSKHRKIQQLNRELDDKVTVLVSATRILGSINDFDELVLYFHETMTRIFGIDRFSLAIRFESEEGWRIVANRGFDLTHLTEELAYLNEDQCRIGERIRGLQLEIGAVNQGPGGLFLLILSPEDRASLDLGADVFDTVFRQFVLAIDNAVLLKKARDSALTDHLTGLYNQRYFWDRLLEEAKRSVRNKTHFSILIIDVDDFKTFNDKYGHLSGDRALTQIASAISNCCRESDIAARYGGEEFVVILPETEIDGAVEVARRIVETVDREIFADGEPGSELTVSVGVAGYPSQGLEPKEIIEQADRALYEAKARGKNRVVMSPARWPRSIKPVQM